MSEETWMRIAFFFIGMNAGWALREALGIWRDRRDRRRARVARTVLGYAGEDLDAGTVLRFGSDGKLYRAGTQEQN